MKYKRIVASNKPVTTVVVQGTPYHYCHSEALGKIRAIIIPQDENLPASPAPQNDPWDDYFQGTDFEDEL